MTYPVLISPQRINEWVQQIVPQLERDREESRGQGRLIQEPTSSSGSLAIDLNDGPIVWVTLTENISSMSIVKPEASDELAFPWLLVLEQDGAGSHTVSFSGDLNWGSGGAPTVSSSAGAIDIFRIWLIKEAHYAAVFDQGF